MTPPIFDRERLNEAQREIELLKDSLAEVVRRNEKQAVLLRALFLLISERISLTESELLERYRDLEIDKMGAPAKRCADCGRTINLQHNKCYYCGARYRAKSAFELLDVGVWPDVATGGGSNATHRREDETDPGETGITIPPGR